MKRRTVLSMEQALSLTYATMRFMQLGWRVIRLEATPSGSGLPGDPNRYVGGTVVDDDRRSYFIAPNVGKEAIALNLKEAEGRKLLGTLIKELNVDIFCCNTLPARYQALGIDYQTLRSYRSDIIWVGLSAMGPDYPNTPGYDPALQAMAGYMELTGQRDGPPTISGVPVIDLKSGDEVYSSVCLALAEKAETGKGKAIDVSMLHAAASWLLTSLPLLDLECDASELRRYGNEHRKFVPVNVYPTKEGFIFIAVGNDRQWEKLTQLQRFRTLANDIRRTNAGRNSDREAIHREIEEVTVKCTAGELIEDLALHKIPHAPIHTVEQVRKMAAVSSKLTLTQTPEGKKIHLPPMAVEQENALKEYAFAPKYSEHTEAILREAGISQAQMGEFRSKGIIS